jgi:hypothetical protein
MLINSPFEPAVDNPIQQPACPAKFSTQRRYVSGEIPQDITGCVQSMDCNCSGEFLIFTKVCWETTSTEVPPPHRFIQDEEQTLGFSGVSSIRALIR